MNKMIAPLWIASLAAAAAVTYWIASDRPAPKQEVSLKKEDVAKQVKQYFSDHPEEVYEAVVAGMRKVKLAEQQKQEKLMMSKRNELENDPETPFAGNPNGDIRIVMFTDYNCGYCRHSAPIIKKLLATDKNIKFVTKEYPILGQGSVVSARAALAVFRIDKSKYFDFYEKMFTTRIRSQQDIFQVVRSVGIDPARLVSEMNSPETSRALQKIQNLGQQLGINSTPAFIINGHYYKGAMGEAEFRRIIASIRAEKKS